MIEAVCRFAYRLSMNMSMRLLSGMLVLASRIFSKRKKYPWRNKAGGACAWKTGQWKNFMGVNGAMAMHIP
ncbi:MAG: hypothetical protein JSS58_04935 [Proteobacteria bacterium]|nr:hypothetical protein [Pseudomonadota bacterium]